ncbi:MAG: organomercurial lyase [Halosimplex sp.]
MWTEVRNSDGIETGESAAELSLSPAVGERFARLYGADERPETVGDWAASMREAIERERGRPPAVEDLCTDEAGDHAFVGDDGVQTYVCVLDPLVYPFLTGETGTVRSTTPVRGTEVAFEVGADGVAVSHGGAVVSIGVSEDVDAMADTPLETVYREVCEYVQTFEDRAEYEAWAESVPAVTMGVPAETGLGIVRELADVLFEVEVGDVETGPGCDCC